MRVSNSTGEIRQNGSNSSNGVLWFGGSYTNASYGNNAACAVNYSPSIPDCYVSIRVWASSTSIVSSYDMMYSQTETSVHMGLMAGGASRHPNNYIETNITYNAEGSNAGIAYTSYEAGNRRTIVALQNFGAVTSGGNYIIRVLSDAIQYISVSWF
jgi:hypothetical protein